VGHIEKKSVCEQYALFRRTLATMASIFNKSAVSAAQTSLQINCTPSIKQTTNSTIMHIYVLIISTACLHYLRPSHTDFRKSASFKYYRVSKNQLLNTRVKCVSSSSNASNKTAYKISVIALFLVF
jgi:hypothetical protein